MDDQSLFCSDISLQSMFINTSVWSVNIPKEWLSLPQSLIWESLLIAFEHVKVKDHVL